MLGALAVAVGFSMFAAPAAHAETHNGITCAPYTHSTGDYPADASHFQICFNNWTLTRVNVAYFAAKGLPSNVRNFIESKGTTYYYFKNRSEMNSFMTGKYGGSSTHVDHAAATCGYTGYSFAPFTQTITVTIFDECIMGGITVSNPDLRKVVHHESGHAFDYALAANKLSNRDKTPSASSGYAQLVLDDKDDLYGFAMCTLFQGAPSAYELQLGATPGAVCTGGLVNPGYTDQVDTAEEKAPYFVAPTINPYQDLFVEQFSILAGGVGGQNGDFTLTDNIIKDGRFDCTFYVVQSYWHSLNPPGPSNPNPNWDGPLPNQCTAVSENDLK